ncbi:MAG: S-adenosylmethionine decarboxylase [Planctomycetes bacterium]|nr:S-adenosylmethionine decarboxylase [Planctomycetota bacterium]
MMDNSETPYGFELILDLHDCDVATFNRKSLEKYFSRLCKAIDMKRCDLHFWDDVGVPPEKRQTLPHTKGTSAVQFILTSTIVIHALDLLKAAYINIFSCKPFDRQVAEELTKKWFGAKECRSHFIERI